MGYRKLWSLFLALASFSYTALAFEELDIRTGEKSQSNPKVVPNANKVVGVKEREEAPEPQRQPAAEPVRPASPRPPWSLGMLRARRPARSYNMYPDLRMRVGILMTERDLSGVLGARFLESQFMNLNGHLRYRSRQSETVQEVYGGPEFLVQFQLPNLTVVTPFAAAGPGYESWKVQVDDRTLSRSGSLYLAAAFGMELNMTPNFALIIHRTVRWYENPLPEVNDEGVVENRLTSQGKIEVLFQYLI